MTFKDYKNLLKDEWEFHKRNPEMFLVWAAILISSIYLLVKWLKG
jgi:hypothetical protein